MRFQALWRNNLVRSIRLRALRLATPPVSSAFHYLYYRDFAKTWGNTSWLGHRLFKNPFDLWIYQEILFELKPDLIIETGTAKGGSALFMASICDLMGTGRIMTIDITDRPGRPVHKRVSYVHGSSTDPAIIEMVAKEVRTASTVMVILDSNHSAAHVSAELEVYSKFVTPGSYLIVEDTNVNGHPVWRSFGPGPMEATNAFLQKSSGLTVDRSKEKFHFTFNPRGFLKRTGAPISESQ